MKNLNDNHEKLKSIALKEILDTKEALIYIGIKSSTLYKLTSQKAIPFSKPNGGKLYFQKLELDQWMLQNKSMSTRVFQEQTFKHIQENGN